MIIALASPPVAVSLDDGLERVRSMVAEAADRDAAIVCFPEAYLPGLRGIGNDVAPFDASDEAKVLEAVAGWARSCRIATIAGVEHVTDKGRQIAAVVIGSDGTIQGIQAKCQLDPSEEQYYVPGHTRQLFQVSGVPFGIAICHEAFRYPETVRWAATRGARIVFHPHQTGGEQLGSTPSRWGDPAAPYYEKAVMCRALENTIYMASVNYALARQESATCVVAPSGACQASLPYGEEGLLLQEIDLESATGLLARRYAPERYPA
ncbi:MAG TPA: carbon-nitrogen hydrolase family protein [Gemmatimonadales bacterium]|jgi:predicted amidohydrolase